MSLCDARKEAASLVVPTQRLLHLSSTASSSFPACTWEHTSHLPVPRLTSSLHLDSPFSSCKNNQDPCLLHILICPPPNLSHSYFKPSCGPEMPDTNITAMRLEEAATPSFAGAWLWIGTVNTRVSSLLTAFQVTTDEETGGCKGRKWQDLD